MQGLVRGVADMTKFSTRIARVQRPRPALAALAVAIVLAGAGLSGCATQLETRGHLLAEGDIQQVRPGMTQDQVRGVLGTPDTTATAGPATFYYMSSTVTGAAFLEPSEVDRHIVAVYFSQFGTVDQVANYTMKDGKVVDVIGRTTPSARGDKSLIDKLFKGIGKKQQLFDPEKSQ